MSFTWVPFYEELAKELLNWRNRQQDLIQFLTDCKNNGLNTISLEDENPAKTKINLTEIDPFTFFSSFNRDTKTRLDLISRVILFFNISLPNFPQVSDFDGIPLMNNQNSWFFGYKYERAPNDIGILWDLFAAILSNKLNNKLAAKLFTECLSIKHVGSAKLTMGLFWMQPSTYIALDDNNINYLASNILLKPIIQSLSKVTKKGEIKVQKLKLTYTVYQTLTQQIVQAFPDKKIYEISQNAYNASITAKQNSNQISSFIPVSASTNLPPSNHPLNTILYGPPGTGKTYNTIDRALKTVGATIPANREDTVKLFNQYQSTGQIEFITFHQNYSYEDFVEGIKPKLDNATLLFERKDGVFKQICTRATKSQTISNKANIFRMALGSDPKRKDRQRYCIKNAIIGLGYDGYKLPLYNCSDENSIKAKFTANGKNEGYSMLNIFINQLQKGDFVLITEGSDKIIAVCQIIGNYQYNEDPSGVMEGYEHQRKVLWHNINQNIVFTDIISYEKIPSNTIDRIKNDKINFEKLNIALAKNNQPHVLIIDEINRANISRVFGELITLIEDDKRIGAENELKITLASGESFGVPSNLYIVGTMNTADRSIALVDIALRRRFTFKGMYPKYDLTLTDPNMYSIYTDQMEFLKPLNSIIIEEKGVDYQIGHSFFMKGVALKEVLNDSILPLLNEYFMGDTKKILSFFDKSNTNQLITTALQEVYNFIAKEKISVQKKQGLLECRETNQLNY